MQKLSERATSLYEKGKYEDARILWREVLKNNPSDTRAATGYRLATMLAEKWSPLTEETEEFASRAAEEIESLLACGKVADAVLAARALLTDCPNDPRAHDVYEAATRAMRHEPVIRVLATRAKAAAEAGRFEEARNCYREILLTDDQNLEALERLRGLDRSSREAQVVEPPAPQARVVEAGAGKAPTTERHSPVFPVAPPPVTPPVARGPVDRTHAGQAQAPEKIQEPSEVAEAPAVAGLPAVAASEEIVDRVDLVEGPVPLASREYVEAPQPSEAAPAAVTQAHSLDAPEAIVDLVDLVEAPTLAAPEEIVDLVDLVEAPAFDSPGEIVDLVDLVEAPPEAPSEQPRVVYEVVNKGVLEERRASHEPLDLTDLDDEIGTVMSEPDPEPPAEPAGEKRATGQEPAPD